MESAIGVNVASGYDDGGPGQEIDGQESKGGGGGGELDDGGGREEAAFVQSIEGFTVKGGYADAEGGMAQCGVGEYNLNFLSELRC